MTNIIDSIIQWIVSLIATFGGFGVAFAVGIENLFPPIPSEVILPLAGFAVAQGQMGFIEASLWATIGSTVGALALYWIGAKIGRERLLMIAEKLPLLKVEDVEHTERWFARHGEKAVFFGRLLPGVRSLISIPAGLNRMSIPRFLVWTTLGSALWNTALIAAGYFLGAQWGIVEGYIGKFQNVLLAIILPVVIFVIWRRIRNIRRSRVRASHSESGTVDNTATTPVTVPLIDHDIEPEAPSDKPAAPSNGIGEETR